MALLDTDLLYLSRGGTLYQVDAKSVGDKSKVNESDLFLVQRDGQLFQIAIGDLWDGTKVLKTGDLFMVQRGNEMFAHAMEIDSFIAFSILNGRSSSSLWKVVVNFVGDAPIVSLPNGSQRPLTKGENQMTGEGIYRFSGDFTEFKITYSDAVIDASLSSPAAWASMIQKIDNFGESLFSDVYTLVNVPANLVLKSCKETFKGTGFGTPSLEADGTIPPYGAESWDVSNVTDFTSTFQQCTDLNWDLSNWNTGLGEEFRATFAQTFIMGDPGCGSWDVSKAVNMGSMFLLSGTNADVSSWTPVSAVDVSNMFASAGNFNSNLSGWNMPNLENIDSMFKGAVKFDSPPPPSLGKVTSATNVFSGATAFNQRINWDFSEVTNLSGLLNGASSYNVDVNTWDVSNVKNLSSAFQGATAFDQSMDAWDTGSVQNFDFTFAYARAFNQAIGLWNTKNATSMTGMFYEASQFDQNLSKWCVGAIASLPTAFDSASGFEGQTAKQPQWGTCPNPYEGGVTLLNGTLRIYASVSVESEIVLPNGTRETWTGLLDKEYSQVGDYILPTDNITQLKFENSTGEFTFKPGFYIGALGSQGLNSCFKNCPNFNANINDWDVSNIDTLSSTFEGCTVFNQPLDNWDVSNIVNLNCTFKDAEAFNQNIGAWNVKECTVFTRTFYGALAFNQNLNGWAFGEVRSTEYMFYRAEAFNQPLNAWNTSSLTSINSMFSEAKAFNQPLDRWDVSNAQFMNNMFNGAKEYEQDLSSWCTESISGGSKPGNFDKNSKFEGKDNLQPDWGNCVPRPVGQYPRIENQTGGLTAEVGDTLIKTQDGLVVYKDKDYGPESQIWQKQESSLSDWLNIPGATGDSYTLSAPQDQTGWSYRLLQHFQADDGAEADLDSNTVVVKTVPSGGYLGVSIEADGRAVISGTLTDAAIFTNPDGSTVNLPAGIFTQNITKKGYYFMESNSLTAISFDGTEVPFLLDTRSDLDTVTDASKMFANCFAFNQALQWWDTNQVTNMHAMFKGASIFNGDISTWDMNRVDDMSSMFEGAKAFNTIISGWEVTSATNLANIFKDTSTFDQSISAWSTSNVTNCSGAFQNAAAFNSSVLFWNVRNVLDFSSAFEGASSFNQRLDQWSPGSATNMDFMFKNASVFNQNINSWCVDHILTEPTDFAGGSLIANDKNKWPNWGTCVIGESQVYVPDGTTLKLKLTAPAGSYILMPDGAKEEFEGTKNWTFIEEGIYTIQMAGVTYINFKDSVGNFTISPNFYTGDVTSLSECFYKCEQFTGENIELWDVSKVTNFSQTFRFCLAFNRNISNWDVSKATNFQSMFSKATVFNQPLSEWNINSDPSQTVSMYGMFQYTEEFDQDLNTWDVSRVNIFTAMFADSVYNTNLNGWDMSNAKSINSMFQRSRKWNQPITWNLPAADTIAYMFASAEAFNQNLDSFAPQNLPKLQSRSATTDYSFFAAATTLNQDLSHWDFSVLPGKVTLKGFFQNARAYNLPLFDITSNVINISNMFTWAVAFNQPLGNADFSGVTNIANMFANATQFDQDLSSYCVPLVPKDSDQLDNVFKNTPMEAKTDQFFKYGEDCGGAGYSSFTVTVAPVTLKVKNSDPAITTYIKYPDGSQKILANKTPSLVTLELTELGTYEIPTAQLEAIRFQNSDGTFRLANDFKLRAITDLSYAFRDTPNFDQDLGFLDVSGVINMSRAFSNSNAAQATDYSSWDVGNVTDMSYMFENNPDFNRDLPWGNLKVESIEGMFANCFAFNGDVSTWNFIGGPQKNMQRVFANCSLFNGDLSSWASADFNSVELWTYFLFQASSFEGKGLEKWNINPPVAKQNLYSTFWGTKITDQLSNWKMRPYTTDGTFRDSLLFNSSLAKWDFTELEIARYMFFNCQAFNNVIGDPSISGQFRKTTNFDRTFANARIFNTSISHFDVKNITMGLYMFSNASKFNQPIGDWDTSNMITALSMFQNAIEFSQDLSTWCVSNVTCTKDATRDSKLDASQTPKWGSCPYGMVTKPIIRVNGNLYPINYQVVLSITQDATNESNKPIIGNQWQQTTTTSSTYTYDGITHGTRPTETGYFYCTPNITGGVLNTGYPLKNWNYLWLAPRAIGGGRNFYDTLIDPSSVGKYLYIGTGYESASYLITNGPNPTYGFAAQLVFVQASNPEYNPVNDADPRVGMWICDDLEPEWADIPGQQSKDLSLTGSNAGHAIRVLQSAGSISAYYSNGLHINSL